MLALGGRIGHCLGLECPPGWTQRDQSCYLFDSTSRHEKSEAETMCRQLDGYLVVPNSAEENQFIHYLFMNVTTHPQLWLGFEIRKDPENGTAACPDTAENGEKLSYCHVYTEGNPAEQEGCGVMSRSTGRWRGSGCGHAKFTMCERRAAAAERCRPFTLCHTLSSAGGGCHLLPPDHTLTQMEGRHPVQCCVACLVDPNCRSFNLLGNATCVLNAATVSQVNTLALQPYQESCTYYEPMI
ncbi:snaclec agglucetin subunit alpha-1-like [Acanthaster planci]|uniref:Snaclec agglucetin subunit alpha-1-like n=1 Tax=Acanthaster planci TaxID=133434 RepID=A0A8B7ZN39_ACAPL|nr:snaclec agglucetin subunit alpha-1-like [Acanthaster planci]